MSGIQIWKLKLKIVNELHNRHLPFRDNIQIRLKNKQTYKHRTQIRQSFWFESKSIGFYKTDIISFANKLSFYVVFILFYVWLVLYIKYASWKNFFKLYFGRLVIDLYLVKETTKLFWKGDIHFSNKLLLKIQ